MHQIVRQAAPVQDLGFAAGLREDERLSALDRLDLLDTPREESFERIVRLIRTIFDVPIALVSLMDGHRQWHKACSGLADGEVERRNTFCRYPVESGQPLVVRDASVDARFADNPNVAGAPGIRFYAGVPLQTSDGHNIGSVCAIGLHPREFDARELQILTDLAQLTMDTIELRGQADTDALTTLLSRRAFKEQGARAMALALRHRHAVSCITIDIDHFKTVNDMHGHAAGDVVLKTVAEACRGPLRATDLIGRLGGEEFAVLLTHAELGDALGVAEKLRSAIGRKTVDIGKVAMRVTASFGVASIDPATQDIDTLLARADEALYAAKAEGRDRCVSLQRKKLSRPPQRRVLKGGRILFNNRFSTIDCTIRSLGEDGAGIDVWNTLDLPERFTLIIVPDGVEKECRITERTEKHIEVQFS